MTYEEIRQYRNEMNPFAKKLGIECVEIREGYARSEMKVDDSLRNPQGAVQGGVYYTLADVAGANAAACDGDMVATLDSDFHFLRAGLQLDVLKAEARALKRGKRISVFFVEVSDPDGKILASGTFTYSSLGKKIGE